MTARTTTTTTTIPSLPARWLRADKRLAIYLRDNCCCVYCGRRVSIGSSTADADHDTLATIDHVEPRARFARAALAAGRSLREGLLEANTADNLATCCKHCNSLKNSSSKRTWTKLAASRGISVDWRAIGRARKTNLKHFRATAKLLLGSGRITGVNSDALTAALETLS